MNNLKYILLILMLNIGIHSYSKELKYPVNEIPDSLKINAQAIIRESNEHLIISSWKDARLNVTKVITILNENGDNNANLNLWYDKFRKIKNISGTIYDQDGNKIDKIKSGDIRDYSAISGGTVYSDNRVIYINPREYPYPFTIEYNYEIKMDEFFSYPGWSPIADYYMAVQNSSYSAFVADGMSFNYYESNLPCKVKIDKQDGGSLYSWSVSNITAIKPETFSPSGLEFFPVLLTAPTNFEMEGYKGNLSSWNEFGKWIYKLNKEQIGLPESTINNLKVLVKDAKTDKEKVAIIYKHLQNNCRYVSIQVGIGGWQPMPPADVERLAYGDCKALSFYMHSMLEAIGIKSNYTLVNAGSNPKPLIEEFISSQFNHAILCVPMASDTMWLECTSQDNPSGFIGSFTDDRKVLIIKPEGGELIKTKAYSGTDNLKSTKAVVKLMPNGNSTANIETSYNGIHFSELMRIILSESKDKERMMYKKFDLPGFIINDFSHDVIYKEIPTINEKVDMELKNICTTFGNRLIFCPNLLNKEDIVLNDEEERKTDIKFSRSMLDIDTINFVIPYGYVLANEFKKVAFETKFGGYSCELVQKNDQLCYVRKFELYKGIYSNTNYPDLVAYLDQIIKADNSKVALIKQ